MSEPRREMMDFSDYPKPYNTKLPHYIRLARERLSMTGNAVLDELLRLRPSQGGPGGDPPDWWVRAFEDLPEWDKDFLRALSNELADAALAKREWHRQQVGLADQILGVMRRAREIEPSLPDSTTLQECIEVLKRHGEPPGISDEALEMYIGVTPADE